MYNLYKHKIKTVKEICEIVGPKPRDKAVVMCHGTFDIVHPGHIRHLMYAKEQGDMLIASLTTDEYISKGYDRPYVPQDLRAANLSALEIVDYVLIDYQATPLKNIEKIQPDYFVKGFEYSEDGIHPKTKEEMEIVSSYGGEFLFSPGDVVYSSSKLLSLHKPALTFDKLITLMDAENISFDNLIETINDFSNIKVHIVGDTIVDKYSHCSLLGATTKTPTFSVKLENSKHFIGGAGIVAKHLRSLGANVTFTTILGDDDISKLVINDMNKWEIQLNAIHDGKRPTTVKERFWVDNYKMLQVDTLDNNPLADKFVNQIKDIILNTKTDIVIFSDFRHGLFHSSSIDKFTDAIPEGAMKVADTQVSNRWGNILDFKNFDLITPNEFEARFALADQDSGVRHLAYRLIVESNAKNLILKMGSRGVLGYRYSKESPRSFFHLDSFAENVIDGVGAGDALLAAVSLSLWKSKDIIQSTILGNIAAAIACEIEGNVPITNNLILDRLESISKNNSRGLSKI